MDVSEIKTKIPQYIFDVSRILQKEGYEAYLVGGGVRDMLMGRKPKDYDIATDAHPEVISKIFTKAVATGAKFGSIIVLVKDSEGEPHSVDVTTYRAEEYLSGRWPSKVEFITSIEGDLSRRDFTINAIAVDLVALQHEREEVIFDPFSGQEDIKKEIIQAVGDPEERFKEDALRALRACRFASVLGFNIDSRTKNAIESVLSMIDNLSAERIRDEFLKIIHDSPKPSVGLKLLKDTGILKIWIPELLEGVGIEQPEYHYFDVFEHSLRTVDRAEDSVKLAALFHDIGKPRKKAGAHFYGHDIEGALMTEQIMKRLRFSKKDIKDTANLVRWHMFYFPYDEEDLLKGKKIIRKRSEIGKWGDSAIRRFVRNVGGEEAVDELIKLRIADATANPRGSFDEQEIVALQKRIAEVREKDMALKISDLDIDGDDLKKAGIDPGPQMGKILNELLEIVIEDPTMNDKEKLLGVVKENYLGRLK
ncbi:HD domain-containing protein [Candidatus Dojkabacteria bacterium]|nr:HD domain-containing protein [Candidatus Dojkabacteria bacterium]